jgi:hypothetical protein
MYSILREEIGKVCVELVQFSEFQELEIHQELTDASGEGVDMARACVVWIYPHWVSTVLHKQSPKLEGGHLLNEFVSAWSRIAESDR